MSARYRAVIIGHTGQGDYGHGLDIVYDDVPEVEVVAVADPDAEGLATARERIGAANAYADYREMLAREEFDLVNVCPRVVTPHAAMVIAAAEAGARGIFCEKPLAASLVEADAMMAACAARNVKVAVAHRRANPYEQYGKKLIDEGAIGQLQVLRARGKWDRRHGAEDLAVLGPHMMDSMRYFAGADVAWAHAHVSQGGREVALDDVREGNEGIGLIAGSSIAAYYAFANGVTAHFESQPGDTEAKVNSRWFGFDAHGSEGIISLRNSPNGEMYIYRHGMFIPDGKLEWERVLLDDWEAIEPRDRTHHSNISIVRELMQAIEEDRDVVEASSGRDALAALEMIMAVHESQRLKGRVEFPLVNRENPYEVWRREAG
ncbi:MAG: Gfo/Idh/MocA family oxidoreductase [Candidatus Latescibacteria bacterium]|nr:Gfo/Idh/MocA family oxidoreductase [Candidatus Latescibacterota bacterium]